ncbi:hypothetical protein M413DRAFT_37326, partial [Hebeloma cylindrosporum]
HQNGLGQALGAHLPAYNRTTDYRHPSNSPPTISQQPHAAPSSSLAYSVQQPAATSPAMKRKQVDPIASTNKRRRETGADEGDSYDIDGNQQGAKHWTDEEKSRLFNWLMGPGQEDHWNALRATKNSCLRECAVEVFGGKKTYQALKGCYERNFNLFKQIYAFETAHGQPSSSANLSALSEADRIREFERRLSIVRKTGTDIGSVTARTIDHWHRVGWYELFYRRWHGDPATTRPVQGRSSVVGTTNSIGGGADEAEDDDPTSAMDGTHFNVDPSSMNGLNGMAHDRQQQQHVYINPQDLRENNPPPPAAPPGIAPTGQQQQQSTNPDLTNAPILNFPLTQDLTARIFHYLNLQAQIAQEKLDYLRRREARELKELNARKELEKTQNNRNKSERAF